MSRIAEWTPITDALAAYWARRGTSGESVTPWEAMVALAAGALEILEPRGLKDAYPRYDGTMVRGYGSEAPFWFTRPIPRESTRLEQRTLGGDAALGPVPGGEVVMHLAVECGIALGPSTGDISELMHTWADWVFNLSWFFSLNRTLGGFVEEVPFNGMTFEIADVKAIGDWYCLLWPGEIQLRYIMPASG